jgi:hypothetical protein
MLKALCILNICLIVLLGPVVGSFAAHPECMSAQMYEDFRNIFFDCNGNGIRDEVDLVNGVIQDADGDGLFEETLIAEIERARILRFYEWRFASAEGPLMLTAIDLAGRQVLTTNLKTDTKPTWWSFPPGVFRVEFRHRNGRQFRSYIHVSNDAQKRIRFLK